MNQVTLTVSGPYASPGYEIIAGLPALPANHGGVYIQTFQAGDKFFIHAPGVSVNVLARARQHVLNRLAGKYNILDADLAQTGVRALVYQGWSQAIPGEFARRGEEVKDAARRMEAAMRIFLFEETPARLSERIEGAIIRAAWDAGDTMIDRGMFAHRTRADEAPLEILIVCESAIRNLPERLILEPPPRALRVRPALALAA